MKYSSLLFLIFIFLFSSCKKEESEKSAEPVTYPKISSIAQTDDNGELLSAFTYDEEGLLKKMTITQNQKIIHFKDYVHTKTGTTVYSFNTTTGNPRNGLIPVFQKADSFTYDFRGHLLNAGAPTGYILGSTRYDYYYDYTGRLKRAEVIKLGTTPNQAQQIGDINFYWESGDLAREESTTMPVTRTYYLDKEVQVGDWDMMERFVAEGRVSFTNMHLTQSVERKSLSNGSHHTKNVIAYTWEKGRIVGLKVTDPIAGTIYNSRISYLD